MAAAAIIAGISVGLDTLGSLRSSRSARKSARAARNAETVRLLGENNAITSEIGRINQVALDQEDVRTGLHSQLSRAKNARPGLADLGLAGNRLDGVRDRPGAENPIPIGTIGILLAVGAIVFIFIR